MSIGPREAGVAQLSFISAPQTAEAEGGTLFSEGHQDLDDWPGERHADGSDLIKCASSAARSPFPAVAQSTAGEGWLSIRLIHQQEGDL